MSRAWWNITPTTIDHNKDIVEIINGARYKCPLIISTMSLLWSIVVGVRFHQALDISTQLSWKTYLINDMVGIIWIIIFVFLVNITISTA